MSPAAIAMERFIGTPPYCDGAETTGRGSRYARARFPMNCAACDALQGVSPANSQAAQWGTGRLITYTAARLVSMMPRPLRDRIALFRRARSFARRSFELGLLFMEGAIPTADDL